MPTISVKDLRSLLAWGRRSVFRVPYWMYWVSWVVGTIAAAVLALTIGGLPTLVVAGIATLALLGVLRWWYARRKARHGLVVPMFAVPDLKRAEEIQDRILTELRDNVTPETFERVRPLRVVIGASPRHERLALRVWRGISARYLLHGEVLTGSGVFARVLQAADTTIFHEDPHTRDATPSKTSWRHRVLRLTEPPPGVQAMYPLHFAGDLAAVARSIAGLVATDPKEREALLRDAIAASPDSRSQQLDHLRVLLARSMMDQGRTKGALSMLRTRAKDEDASSELLRALAGLIAEAKSGFAASRRTEAEWRERARLLRRAADDRSDVQRPQTLYNLASITELSDPQQREASKRVFRELLDSRSHYADAWYVRRDLGAIAWYDAKDSEKQGDNLAARRAYLEAAKWYARAIRARRRGQFFLRDSEGNLLLYFRYPPSPVLFANAAEAFSKGGDERRWRHYEHDFQSSRRTLLRLGLKRWAQQRFQAAYALIEWTIVGRHDDDEAEVRTYVAVLLWQIGQDAEAGSMWAEAMNDSTPAATDTLARIRADPQEFPLTRALPF